VRIVTFRLSSFLYAKIFRTAGTVLVVRRFISAGPSLVVGSSGKGHGSVVAPEHHGRYEPMYLAPKKKIDGCPVEVRVNSIPASTPLMASATRLTPL
jgi:hypothetical protein